MGWNSSTVSVGDPTEKADYDRLMDNTIYLKDGDTVFTGAKSFQSSTVFVEGPDWKSSGYEVNSVGVSSTVTIVNMVQKVLEIGDWNMSGTTFVNIAHGLNILNIRNVHVMIRRDDDAYSIPIGYFASAASTTPGGTVRCTASDVTIARVTGEYFDDATFNSTGFNRGFIYIDHVI